MDLSICIITKNECNKLARLLASAEKMDCEIVVVDTGSSDDTIETAYRYTDRVFFYKWRDDFADAKNLAASRATNDVVMILDTDEWITGFGDFERENLSELVRKLETETFGKDNVGRIKRINILEKDGERLENHEWINRIYNRRFFEYEGRIHEQLVRRGVSEEKMTDGSDGGGAGNSSACGKQGDDYSMRASSVRIYHDGYLGTPEEKKRKAERNMKLLLAELDLLDNIERSKVPGEPDNSSGCSDEINASDKSVSEKNVSEKNAPEKSRDRDQISRKTYILYQLGKSCYMAGDPAKAADYFDKALSYDLNPHLEYVIDMVETYGYALMNSGQEQKALGLEGVLDDLGENADFCFMMGLVYMKNAMFHKAVFCFDEALQKKECRMQGVNSYLAHYNKGVIYECLGQKDEARICYGKAGDYVKAKEGLSRL